MFRLADEERFYHLRITELRFYHVIVYILAYVPDYPVHTGF
jgi:hypothetical protein